MNLKHAFYKWYYEDIDWLNATAEDTIASSLRNKNQRLFDYKPDREDLESLILFPYVKNYYQISLTTIYPGLLLGSGYTHEINNKEELILGFFMDHITGLPLIPGSSVKGALRSVFPSFKSNAKNVVEADLSEDKVDAKQKAKANYIFDVLSDMNDRIKEDIIKLNAEEQLHFVYQLENYMFEGKTFVNKDEKWEVKSIPMKQRTTFFDAGIIHPYEGKSIMGGDVITPHGDKPLRNPTPLPFLKVLPDVTFNFQFSIRDIQLQNGIEIEAGVIKGLFERILMDMGIGAKTNVGYGQMEKVNKGQNKLVIDIIRKPSLEEKISKEAELKLAYHTTESKNMHEGVIIGMDHNYYQVRVFDGCLLLKSIQSTKKAFERKAERLAKKNKEFRYKELEVGDKVTIRINKQLPGKEQGVNFSILPIIQ